ncbi:TIGR03545 family protein [Agaribacter flavus]|uniref:TIGR03545 family protein n=1 Tax=Agaribacter flavus TaxID=1902781 RepID=A0ABV7FVN9_9ALTE
MHIGHKQHGKISLFIAVPIALIGLLVILYLLFANSILKGLAESSLGNSLGAEVNIADLDHSLFPFGVELKKLEATDPSQPNRNKFEIGVLSADVDLFALLSSKVIIEELLVDNLQFGTTRTNEGEVYREVESPSSFAFPTLADLPSVDEVLANTPLKTTAAIADAKAVYKKYEAPLQEKYAALPDKDKVESYKYRIKALQDTDLKNPVELAKAVEELKQLKEEIKKDKTQVSEFVNLAKQAKNESAASVTSLKNAPQQDYDLLKVIVGGDEAAIGQVSQHLFGDKAELYLKALLAVGELAISNTDTEAEQVETKTVTDDSGLPSLWVKAAKVSVNWLDESLVSEWKNITGEHHLVGSPTTFLVNSTKANNWESIDISGQFENINGALEASQSWHLSELVLNEIQLVPESAKQKLTAILNSGLLNSQGELSVVGTKLTGQSSFKLKELALLAEGSNALTDAVADLLSKQQSIDLESKIQGSITSPSVVISSNLDKQLVSALGDSIQDNPKLNELKQKLSAKVNDQLGTSTDQFENIEQLLSAAEGDSQALSSLLSAQLADPKQKALDKLKNKLFNR